MKYFIVIIVFIVRENSSPFGSIKSLKNCKLLKHLDLYFTYISLIFDLFNG